jgi:hypothetical protein
MSPGNMHEISGQELVELDGEFEFPFIKHDRLDP